MSSRKNNSQRGGGNRSVAAHLLLTLVAYLGLQVVLRYAGAVRGPIVEALCSWGLTGQEARFFGSAVATSLMAAVVALYIIASRTKVSSGGNGSLKSAFGSYIKGAAWSLVMIGAVVVLSALGGGIRFVGAGDVGVVEFAAVMLIGMLNVREELLYRGWMMSEMRGYLPTWVAVVASSLLFGLAHIFNPGVTVLALVNLSLLGAFWALCLLKTQSLWMVMAMHTFWNFAQGKIVGMAVSGSGHDIASIWKFEGVDSGIWGTGAFGLEGNLATTIVIVVAIAVVAMAGTKKRMIRYKNRQSGR